MQYKRDVHHRRSIRLRAFDYSQPGAYFITVCTHERALLFGDVVNGAMVLNAAGVMVDAVWRDITNHFPLVVFGEYVVMPNHFHGIVHIVAGNTVGAIHESPLHGSCHRRGMLLSKLVGRFKMVAAKKINLMNATSGQPVWQRNYYEHIIRHEQAYAAIAEYIHHNPQRWQDDVYCCNRGDS